MNGHDQKGKVFNFLCVQMRGCDLPNFSQTFT